MLQACLIWSSEPLWPSIQTPGKTGLPDFRRFVLEELHTRGIPGRLLGRLIFEPLLDLFGEKKQCPWLARRSRIYTSGPP
jgi:hypothetical protein